MKNVIELLLRQGDNCSRMATFSAIKLGKSDSHSGKSLRYASQRCKIASDWGCASLVHSVVQSVGREWGGLDPLWLDLVFLGRPDFPSRGPKTPTLKGLPQNAKGGAKRTFPLGARIPPSKRPNLEEIVSRGSPKMMFGTTQQSTEICTPLLAFLRLWDL